MKIAVFSDVHENAHNLILALEYCEKAGVEKILFLGDFINNGVAKIFAASSIPVFAVWGNNDGDKVAIVKTSLSSGSNLEMGFDTFDSIVLDGKRIFMTHYPMLAKPMAKSGDFDAVFYGHDHKSNIDAIGNCIIVNPGELGAHKFGKASFALYDTSNNHAELILLDNSISLQSAKVDQHLDTIGVKLSTSKGHKY